MPEVLLFSSEGHQRLVPTVLHVLAKAMVLLNDSLLVMANSAISYEDYYTQRIYLSSAGNGYNLISFYINPDLAPPFLWCSEVFDIDPETGEPQYDPDPFDCLPDVEQVLNYSNAEFNPNQSFTPYSTGDLGWNMNNGYQVKMFTDGQLQDTILTIRADELGFYPDPVEHTITIPIQDLHPYSGAYRFWITIPCWQNIVIDENENCPFFNIISNDWLRKIDDDEGNVFIPGEINEIGTLKPGKGYSLWFDRDHASIPPAIFHVEPDLYPEPPSGNSIGDEEPRNIASDTHFHFSYRTICSYPIYVDTVMIENVTITSGDEIAVLTPDSLCVGASVYQGEFPVKITAWEDDPLTEVKDGYYYGEEIIFALWDKDTEMEYYGDESSFEISGVQINSSNNNNKSGFGQNFYSIRDVILEGPEITIPIEFALHQNFPNPFNPMTNIKYELPEISHVKLTIYNISGQIVTVLVEGLESPGYKQAVWNGKSSNGKTVSSGLYIYKLEAEGKTSGKKFCSRNKMLLIK